ncbi:MAG: hypothetical protein R3C49_02760 [Planctomycetaceae bacterium]
MNRRQFLRTTSTGVAAGLVSAAGLRADETAGGALSTGVEVLHPYGRIPLSFVIDDSTCLVNMGHFCTPQFAECYPDRAEYRKPWKQWPREIPDAFVREFGEWCAQHGVRGKYSIVPYPACTGWLDRELPGWSKRELEDSLKLVRELMVPNWDIHPEMITHTRVIDLKTGRPFAAINPATMENSYPQQTMSADQLAEYLAYALRILKNCGLPCEGVTTPGGFGNRVKSELSLAVQQAVTDVFAVEIPHYFKYVKAEAGDLTDPVMENYSRSADGHVSLTMNVPAGTGDWFGGWQGDTASDPDRYATEDASAGRMVELIQRGQPAVMLCHWPGMYSNGTREGFRSFQRIVTSLQQRFSEQTRWMKLSEMARYQAARQLTTVASADGGFRISAPFSCPGFTIRISSARLSMLPVLRHKGDTAAFRAVPQFSQLSAGTLFQADDSVTLCFDLPVGESTLTLARA